MIAAKSGNPYLQTIAERYETTEFIRQHSQKITELKEKGAKLLEAKEKISLAGMSDEYRALFVILNDTTHTGLRALGKRHFRKKSDSFELVAFAELGPDDFIASMQSSYDLALRASVEVHDYFETPYGDHFRKLTEASFID